jgi:zinc/manganese transport system substrate-binding protein
VPGHGLVAITVCAVALLASGCGSGATAGRHVGFLVVAGENMWGSIAAQLAGDRATVQSIIVNPNTDPHSYEPTAADARTVAGARMVIANGIGYDDWLTKLAAADGTDGQLRFNIGDLLGLTAGDNPHQWYSPASVERAVHQITADYQRLEPSAAAYFAGRERAFLTTGLAGYRRLIAQVRARYAGVPVGYSESIFQPLGVALGLRLLTPYSFAKAVAEGTDISAADKLAVDNQAQQHQIKVWVFNSQNVTADVQQVNALARAAGIPIATVTETLSPATDSFQQWQDEQLRALSAALSRATGR